MNSIVKFDKKMRYNVIAGGHHWMIHLTRAPKELDQDLVPMFLDKILHLCMVAGEAVYFPEQIFEMEPGTPGIPFNWFEDDLSAWQPIPQNILKLIAPMMKSRAVNVLNTILTKNPEAMQKLYEHNQTVGEWVKDHPTLVPGYHPEVKIKPDNYPGSQEICVPERYTLGLVGILNGILCQNYNLLEDPSRIAALVIKQTGKIQEFSKVLIDTPHKKAYMAALQKLIDSKPGLYLSSDRFLGDWVFTDGTKNFAILITHLQPEIICEPAEISSVDASRVNYLDIEVTKQDILNMGLPLAPSQDQTVIQ